VRRESRISFHHRFGAREEQGYGARAGEIATELAAHFERGREYERAVHYLELAAHNASQRSAHQETVGHPTKGLALLTTSPDTSERTWRELRLQMALGPALMASKGFAAPEAGHSYARARQLCQQVEEAPPLFRVLWGLQVFYNVRAEYQTSRELAEQMLALAQHQRDLTSLLLAHAALGRTLFLLGEPAAARTHLEQGLVFYARQPHHIPQGLQASIVCFSWAAMVLWSLGYAEQALQRSQQALTLARELAHPLHLAYALSLAAGFHAHRRDADAAHERAEAAIALATEHGFPLQLAQGTLYRGWALAAQGRREEGLAQMHQGLHAMRATGAGQYLPSNLARLAEVSSKSGQTEEGLHLVTEALSMMEKTGERYYEAELHRLKGELLLALEDTGPKLEEAETSFRHALEVARGQRAKSLELRIAVGLSRLWQQQGKRDDARQLLAEIYGWFTEGFATADLQEAKALLEELGV
jgi:predicted ATPase